jgi:choloylglycine hydrolase
MFENNNTYAFDLKKMDVNAKEMKYVKLAQPKIVVPVN